MTRRAAGLFLVLSGMLVVGASLGGVPRRAEQTAQETDIVRKLTAARQRADRASVALAHDEVCDARVHVLRTQDALDNIAAELGAGGRAPQSTLPASAATAPDAPVRMER